MFRDPQVARRGGRRSARASRTTTVLLALALATSAATPALAQPGRPPQTSGPDLATLDLEQLMQLEVVYAASKRNQNPREAASVISIVTAAEIRQHGYRTLADVLRSLPSFYISYDRNYSYIGVRGFAQPGDYSTRVLLLLNGLRTNDNMYDQAYVGEEFLVDIDLIDRIEVVRGPSAAIYGSSAFFAVINVVTKRGSDVQGVEISGSGASFGTFGGRATYGTAAGGVEILASASITDRAGPDGLYFQEFDDPSTNDGITRNADGETASKFYVSASKGNLALEVGHSTRTKVIPTGAYETAFNDPRTRTLDRTSLASLSYERPLAKGSASARLHAGRWGYHGEYAYDPTTAPNQDLAAGEWWGVDLDATRSLFDRNLVTVGVEYRDNYRQDQKNYDRDPYELWMDEHHESRRVGLFAQNELKLLSSLVLYTGIRQDWYDTFGSATSPRLGLIYNPDAATTVKLMLGRAFRAPNEYELHYGGSLSYKLNPDLGAERIETVELAAERRIGGGFRLIGSAFSNHIRDLISLQQDPADDLFVFRNLGRIRSRGLELGLDVNRGRGPTGRVSYAFQKTSDRDTGVELTNSPNHMAKLRLWVPTPITGLSTGLETEYVSARKTLAGAEADAYTVSNVSLNLPPVLDRLDVSAAIYNVFAASYGFPGSEEHPQDVIQQDRRTFRVKATLRF